MKNYLIILFLCTCFLTVKSQQGLFIVNSTLSNPFGGDIFVTGDFVNDTLSGGTVLSRTLNTGNITITGNVINTVNGPLFWNDSSGRVTLQGTSTQIISNNTGSINLYTLEVNNPAGVQITSAISVNDTLLLTNGSVDLNGDTIYLKNNIGSGMLVGENNTNKIFGASGEIRTTRNLNGGGNIAGLGLVLESGNQLGAGATIRRGHQVQTTAGDGGITRYFILEPTTIDTVKIDFQYLDYEIGGLTESDFQIFKNQNNTTPIWRQENGGVEVTTNSVDTATVAFGTWNMLTISEASCDNPPNISFTADTMYKCGTDSVLLDPQLGLGYDYHWNVASTDTVVYVQTAGTYTLEVIDSSGCIAIDTITVIAAPNPVANFIVSPSAFSCLGDSTHYNASTSTGNIVSYIWDYLNDGTSIDTLNVDSTVHLFTVGQSINTKLTVITDAGCVASYVSANYEIDSLPYVDFTYLDACEDSIVSFASTSFGRGAYNSISTTSYYWNFGDGNSTLGSGSNQTHTYTTSGIYTVQLIAVENSGCQDTILQSITIHNNPTAVFYTDQVCEGVATSFSNISPLANSYLWDLGDGNTQNNQGNFSYSYASDGVYTAELTATSSFGCHHSVTNTVTVDQRPIASFNTNNGCLYDTLLFNQTTIDAISPSYSWDFADGNTANTYNTSHHYAIAGNYGVKLLVTSSNGCADSVTNVVSLYPIPTAGMSFTDHCADSIVPFTSTSTTGFGSPHPGSGLAWDFGNSQTATGTTPTATYTIANTYSISLIATSSFGCSDTAHTSIVIHPNPLLNWTDTISTCGTTLILDAENVGSSYTWNTTETTQTINVNTDGMFNVNVVTPFGCHDLDSTYAQLNVLVNPNLGNDTTVCDSITLSAYSPSSTYSWSTTDATSDILVTTSGQYFVNRIDQNSCNGTDTITVTVNISPSVNLGADITFCDGNSQLFNANNSGLNYLWNTTETSQSILKDTTGTYSVLVTDLSTGCFGEDTVVLTVNPLPILSLGNDTIVCDQLTLSPGIYNSYAWNDASTNSQLTATTTGQYWLEVNNSFLCITRDTINITINNSPIFELGNDTTLCQNASITLTGASFGSHIWSNASTLNNLNINNAGIYYLDVIDGICSATDTINIQYDSIWSLDLGVDTGSCAGLDITILPNYTNGLNFNWYQGANLISTNDTLIVSQTGTYIANATNGYNCFSTDTINYAAYPYPVASDFLMASEAHPADTIYFVPVTLDSNITYLWSFGEGGTSLDSLPWYRYALPGDYDVTLLVSNGFCTDSLIKTITISPTKSGFRFNPDNYIHTESTILDAVVYPNPNNGNFTLSILLSEEKEVELSIMNVEGKVILEQKLTNEIEQHYQLDLSTSISPGFYTLAIKSGVELKTLKIIVK